MLQTATAATTLRPAYSKVITKKNISSSIIYYNISLVLPPMPRREMLYSIISNIKDEAKILYVKMLTIVIFLEQI